jgi:lipoyl(octanoyl) transferase
LLLTDYKYITSPPLDQTAADDSFLTIRRLGLQDYEPIWRAMRYIAEHPEKQRGDEIWLLSHKPVFTLGQAGRREHVLNPGQIPVVHSDRGGQVTYHGPGQLVAYLLLDVKRRRLGVKDLVALIENGVIESLADYGITAQGKPKAPGVYVDDAKIAALGLRIRRGRSYHGLSLNVNVNLAPFELINPCGYEGLKVTRVADLVEDQENLMRRISLDLTNKLLGKLNHQPITDQ